MFFELLRLRPEAKDFAYTVELNAIVAMPLFVCFLVVFCHIPNLDPKKSVWDVILP
jgi:hypothetical protein